MFKKILLTFLLCIFTLSSISFAENNVKILVNNSEIYSDVPPFIINGTTYVPIRFISDALSVDKIDWNQNSQSVTIKTGNKTLIMFVNKNYGYINNSYKALPGSPILKNNRAFVPLRLISETFDANVNWNSETHTVSINTNTQTNTPSNDTSSTNKPSNNASTTTKPSIGTSSNTKPSNNTSSSNNSINLGITDIDDATYWLARIIEAESSGEPYQGKVAVGEVILNRVQHESFPNTIWGVIFDDTYAIQFEPVANGTIYNNPSSESIKAAKEALNGSNYAGDSLYFLNPKIAASNWIVKNREFYATIANHDFYL